MAELAFPASSCGLFLTANAVFRGIWSSVLIQPSSIPADEAVEQGGQRSVNHGASEPKREVQRNPHEAAGRRKGFKSLSFLKLLMLCVV